MTRRPFQSLTLIVLLAAAATARFEPSSPYDLNADGVVDVQDVNLFAQAIADGTMTVQDINPFIDAMNARPAMTVIMGRGGAIYTDSQIPLQPGLDPDRHYIICRGLIDSEGVTYAQGAEGRVNSVEQLCGWLGATPDATTIIVVPQETSP